MSKYNISKTSRFLGISSELLRHYERLGLIEPERHENGYRIFDYRQIDKLQGIRRFRNMGFSLAEIDRLIGCAAYDEVGALLEKAIERSSRDILWLTELEHANRTLVEEWRQLPQSLGRCDEVLSPEIVRVDIRHNSQVDEAVISDELMTWLEHTPVVFISPAFPRAGILSGSEDIRFGYGIEVAARSRLSLACVEGEQHLASRRCITTVVFSRGQEHISCRHLRHVVQYCQAHRLTIAGDAWGITLGPCHDHGIICRHHRVYVPVEPMG